MLQIVFKVFQLHRVVRRFVLALLDLRSGRSFVFQLAQLCMSIVMLAYGAKLVRDNYVTGPDLLAFIIYQLTLGGILSVSEKNDFAQVENVRVDRCDRTCRRSTRRSCPLRAPVSPSSSISIGNRWRSRVERCSRRSSRVKSSSRMSRWSILRERMRLPYR